MERYQSPFTCAYRDPDEEWNFIDVLMMIKETGKVDLYMLHSFASMTKREIQKSFVPLSKWN